MVPKGWVEHTLGDVTARIHQGINTAADKIQYAETGLPILQTKHISSGSIHFDDAKYINKVDYEKYREKYNPRTNNILFSNIGTIGKSCIIKENKDFLIAWNILLIEPLKSVSPEYLHVWLLHYEQIGHFDSLIAGNAAKFINKGSMESLAIPTPPFAEQSKIAQILSTWDKAIATTERLLANSQQQKQALMQQLLTGQKRFVGFTDTWSHESFESLVEINYGKSPKDIPKEGDFPVIGTGGLVSNTSIPLYSKPAVVIGRKGTIDKPVLVTTPFWAIDTTFYCCPKPKCDIQWFYYICSNINLKTYNEASGVPSLSRDTIYGITVKAPSLPEQQKIAQVLSTADAELTNLQGQLAKLKLEKKALMQQLLTGQRRVKLDAEVAA